MVRIYDMRQKEVINIKDGFRFGFICDLEIDIETGAVIAIVVPGPGKVFGMFGHDQEYKIPWCEVRQIGSDIILVETDSSKALIDCDY